jgi:hypothetical protein
MNNLFNNDKNKDMLTNFNKGWAINVELTWYEWICWFDVSFDSFMQILDINYNIIFWAYYDYWSRRS